MKMLRGLILASMLAVAGLADAATSFSFFPATDGTYRCLNSCVGFATNSADTVEYVTVQPGGNATVGYNRVSISIDDVYYVGYVNSPGQQFTAINAQGGYALVTVNWSGVRVCTHSGRGQTCHTPTNANSGTVSIP